MLYSHNAYQKTTVQRSDRGYQGDMQLGGYTGANVKRIGQRIDGGDTCRPMSVLLSEEGLID